MAEGRRHQNMLQGNSNNNNNNHINVGSMPSSSPSSANSGSHLHSVGQAENAILIPLSTADLDVLRVSGIHFSSGSTLNNIARNIATSDGNLNLQLSSGNVIISTAADCGGGDTHHGSTHPVIMDSVSLADQHHHQQQQQQQQLHSQHQQLNFQNGGRSNVRAVLHSNEISSNGIIDTQSLGSSGSILNFNNNDNNGIHSSASGLIQALGAAVSRAVASGNFQNLLPSSLNLPLPVNQSSIINGSEMMTLNTVPTSIISGVNGQLLVNQHQQQQHLNQQQQQHLNPQQQQQHVLNQASSMVGAASLMSVASSVGLHHSTLAAGACGLGSRVDGASVITSSSVQANSSSGVSVTLGSQQHQQLWVQPDQSGFLPAAVNQEGLALQGGQGSMSLAGGSDSQDRASLQGLQDARHFHDMRGQFSGVIQMQTQNNRSYQVPAHSTFEQEAGGHDYQDLGDNSEATPSYPNMQQMSVDSHSAGHLITAPTADSSTLQQGYQLVYDSEHRLLTVQRVMSPSDCTVSQSTLSLETSEAQESSSLLPLSSQASHSYTLVQLSSMPPTFTSGSSNAAEVSTSTMAAMLNIRDRVGSSGVGSLGQSTSSNQDFMMPKIEKPELEGVAECDTTQEDIEYHQHRSPIYMDTSNNIDDDQSLHSTSLHSTMQGSGVVTSGEVIMDSTLDSSDLATLHPVAMETREMVNCQSAAVSSGHSVNSAIHNTAMDIGESMPGPSGLQSLRVNQSNKSVSQATPVMTINKVLRKSRRLELVEQEPRASQRKRDYQTHHYNPDLLWCEDCMQAYDPCCPTHKLSTVCDKIVMSRAWASAPGQVQIFRVPDDHLEPGESNVGVQAKRQIPKFTQFGPFVGELVDCLDSVTRKFFPLMLEQSGGGVKYFETQDENKCNWMMFVRPAKMFAEQNLVAFQYKEDIYFNVTRLIESKQELKVWYAAHYADRLGVKTHRMTEEDLQALDEEDSKFGCFECSRKFRSSAALQQHLISHDSEDIKDFDDEGGNDADFTVEEAGRKVDKQKGTFLRGQLTQGKQRNTNMDLGNYQWKKKSTSMYISKTLKKYKKRQCSEKVLQSMKSMYKKQGKVSGGNIWMCTHCGLTFDNSSLLNLHTLTHAAEDLGMDEIKKLTEEQNGEMVESGVGLSPSSHGEITDSNLTAIFSLSSPMVACPKCGVVFNHQRDLMEHVATHGQKLIKEEKMFDCNKCSKCFSTEEKLLKHQMVHGDDANKPLECPICLKRVMNNSAMACHMKTHSDRKYYDCPVCGQDFDMVAHLKEHAVKHMDELGHFPCTSCPKTFEDFSVLKKHVKSFHSDREFQCPECGKPFPRMDKLRLHMLRHTNHREFMCETCGRQFKRKDKLKEHMKRMHSKEKMEQLLSVKQEQNNLKQVGKFTPKVMPSEYHRFIYKCHTCLLGFKRRGMLVNHLAKRHPDIKPEHVPELNLPILKTQKDFYCQYCNKIYKSSSKRKAHITKIHPGCLVPPSSRKKLLSPDGSLGFPPNSYSHTVSSITTMPHGCKFCHKQYASKAKLLQHQRKSHSKLVEPAHGRRRCKRESHQHQDFLITVTDSGHGLLDRYEAVPIAVVTQTDSLPNTDLLTQAMSELHSYPSEFTISPRLTQGGAPTMVLQPTTIDINQLNQALHSFTAQTGGVATVLTQPPQPISSTQSVTVMAPNGPQTINLSNAQFITRAWSGGFTPSFKIEDDKMF